MATERIVDTGEGPARLYIGRPRRIDATLLLGHGAGGGPDAKDLAALAERLPRHRIQVVRLEQPWRLAGRKIAPAPAVLDRVTEQVCDNLFTPRRRPLIIGGRSAGARVAVRIASRIGAVGCLALAFPLHPPGRPDKSRRAELVGADVPTLVVQGECDPFGTPAELPAGLPDTEVIAIDAADHEFGVPKRSGVDQAEALETICASVVDWIHRVVGMDQVPASALAARRPGN